MKQNLIILLIISTFISCSNSIKKEDKSTPEKQNVKLELNKTDSINTDLKFRKTFPDFVKLANVPDSLNFDTDNMFYGDFNGDNKEDFATAVINLENGLSGIIIIHNSTNPIYRIFGAGSSINGKNNLDWVEKFRIIPKEQNIAPTIIDEKTGDIIGPDQSKTFKLIGDGISIGVKESHGGGILFWNGSDYEWFHIE